MKAYIFDWRGTLDQVPDPVALITRLQSEGHKVFVTSAYLPPAGKPSVQASSGFVQKLAPTATVVEILGVDTSIPLVFVDDEPWFIASFLELLRRRGYTVETISIENFLESL